MTLPELRNKINAIIKKAQADSEAVKKVADERNVSISLNETEVIRSRIFNEFTILQLQGCYFNFSYFHDELNKAIDKLYYDICNKEYYFLSSINFNSYSEKHNTVTLNKIEEYFINLFISEYSLSKDIFSHVKKTYISGKTVFSLLEADFKAFKKIADWTNENTEKILKAITPEDKKKLIEYKQKSYMNEYSVIWDIKERSGVKGLLNDYTVFRMIESLPG